MFVTEWEHSLESQDAKLGRLWFTTALWTSGSEDLWPDEAFLGKQTRQ